MASSGFNNQATPFLKNFPNEILQESELENWINKVIQENKTLSVIDLTKVKNQLYGILSSIKITPIIGIELDRRLSYEYNKNLISKYLRLKQSLRLQH